MKAHCLKRVQILRTDLSTAWDYFSSPLNLAEITPDWLNFKIVSDVPEKMYEGLIVQYNVHPFFGIPIGWVTEITHAKEPHYFVDEQRIGPYRLWHHQHHFKETDDGIEMTDIVHWVLPFEPFSYIPLGGTVAKKLDEIFAYRREKLDILFNG
jgi:ligand-binding SRPBCC domain-containing protein